MAPTAASTARTAAPAAPPAAGAQWRQLSFFEKDELVESTRSPAPDSAALAAWLQSTKITCSTSGRGTVVFGDDHGIVHILNVTFSSTCTFRAHSQQVTHIKQMRRKPILLTIGEDDSSTPTLKIWNVDKDVLDKNRAPVLIQSKKVSHKARVFPVTALAALESMTQIAIGLENGVVLVYRGDLSRARQAKTMVVHEGSEMVTGLGFHEEHGSANASTSNIVLYIVTLARILTCSMSVKDNKQILEEQGSEIGLSLATPQDRGQEMAMARDEAVYFYGPEGRGPCFIIDGEKTLMTWFRGYVVIVSKEAPLRTNALTEFGNVADPGFSTESESPLARSWPSSGRPAPGHVLTIYDLKSKFVAFRGSFGTRRFDASVGTAVGEPIVHVFAEWGDLFVVTKENKVFRLREIDLDSKLELLYSKNMYNLAVSILSYPAIAIHAIGLRIGEAGANNVLPSPTQSNSANDANASAQPIHGAGKADESTSLIIMDIHRRHGDYLYSRGDFDASMKQYIKTIGNLEPSYVIRKFLDAQRIYNLTSYLQSLHDQRLANPNHTTLLLNCYTKLKDVTRLDAFIDTPDAVFDVDTAIRVCRQSGYYTHALRLSTRFHQHEWHLHVLIEDLSQYDDAIVYLSRVPRDQVKRALKSYGHVLVKHRPRQATEILVKACCMTKQEYAAIQAGESSIGPATNGVVESKTVSSVASTPVLQNRPDLARPEDFLSFFVNQPVWCIVFIENVLRKRWGVGKDAFGGSSAQGQAGASTATVAESVVNDPQELSGDPDVTSRQILWDTLLELYLNQIRLDAEEVAAVTAAMTLSSSADAGATAAVPATQNDRPHFRQNWPKKIMAMLQNSQANYDADQALVMCRTHEFRDGTLYLYRRLGLFQDYLDFHMDRHEYNQVLQTCQMFGDKDPSLWKRALVFFVECGAQGKTASETDTNNLVTILDEIERRKMLSQLQIIQLLSKNPNVTLGMVRDYFVRRIESDLASIDASRQLISSYRTETDTMQAQIRELEQGMLTFQSTRCELCRQPLELPTVHFYCKHAFHQRCLGDADQECPKCAPEHCAIQELVATQRSTAKRHDLFVQKLAEGSDHEDKFAMIAEYFSKNVFSS